MKKILIITGSSRGLGKSIVDFALEDDEVIIFSISRSLHADHFEISKDKLVLVKQDLSNPFNDIFIEQVNKFIEADSLIYYFNNASSILPINKIGSFSQFEISNSIKVNVEYPINIINVLISKFIKNQIIIVNLTSGAGRNPVAFWSLYGSAKAYMDLFLKTLQEEKAANIVIYNLDPGVLNTGMQESIRNSAFPKQEYFKSLKEDNKLISPSNAAAKILQEINF